MSMFQKMVEQTPNKYPSRMGQKWSNAEVVKLLTSIQNKKEIVHIAIDHERTIGGINAELKKLAIQYYHNDKKPVEEISKITSLTVEEIELVIKKKQNTIYIER